ncbi:MAG: pyridoxamine 5'-phosphate oxidase family protein [Alphaproteobacteria bacterium]|jgi:nitroimidazol reductase NimA-like FMN-containing flavoprotein (pyridoxamine 5'-phosphate oxidase superfamily)|nr:pyridoxamine 5'-phosphate oxidase family protein [Alphaproteobacteria bacterium]
MAKIAPALQLSPSEIDAVMAREARLRIATMGPGGGINLTPMTFGWAGGRVYIFARGQKVANIRRSATATVLVDSGEAWRQLMGIMMRGEATILETKDAEDADNYLGAAQINLGHKHGLSKDGEPAPYTATAAGKSRRWIVFTPQSVVSWDNAKLPKGGRQ